MTQQKGNPSEKWDHSYKGRLSLVCAEEIGEMSRPLMRQGISVFFPSEFCPLMQSPTSHREVLLDPKILLSKVKGKNFSLFFCSFIWLVGFLLLLFSFLLVQEAFQNTCFWDFFFSVMGLLVLHEPFHPFVVCFWAAAEKQACLLWRFFFETVTLSLSFCLCPF